MPREDAVGEARSAPLKRNTKDVIPAISKEIARLDPGPAAALRGGPLNGAGAAAFWKLLADYSPIGTVSRESEWAAVIQAIAILTPKGRDPGKQPAHDYALPMGRALFEAGVSELRLARLLAARPVSRRELAVRVCRRLAATGPNRFNLVTLADFVLFAEADTTARRIARDYYRADAAARRKPQDGETPTDA